MFYRSLVKYVLHHIQQGVCRHNEACLQVTELVLQFMLFEQGATRAHNGTQLLDAKVRHDVLRAVAHEQGDRIAFLDTQLSQARCKSIAGAIEFGIADFLAIPNIGHMLRLLARVMAQILVQRHIRMGSGLHHGRAILHSVPCASSLPV